MAAKITHEDLIKYEKLILEKERRRCEKDLHFFIKKSWPILEPATPYVDNWHIELITEYLQAVENGQIRRLLINIPPRNTKSLTATVMYPVWTWIKSPHRRFISLSYADTLSKKHSMLRRHLIKSEWYQGNWHDRYRLKRDVDTQRMFENNHQGFMFSTSVGGTLTGEGADIIIIDDPHNPKQAESEAERQQALDFFTITVPTRLNDKKKGAIIVIKQRLHDNDISGHIIKHDLGYEHVCLPAIATERKVIHFPITGKQLIREEGDILNPDREDRPELDDLKKSMGSYAFAGQYQQNPAPEGGGIIKRWWWRYWKPKNRPDLEPVMVKNGKGEYIYIEAEELTDNKMQTYISADLPFKDKIENDKVGVGIWKKYKAKKFLMELIEDNMSFTETLNLFRGLSFRYVGYDELIIEDKANGPAVIDVLKNEISRIIPFNPDEGNKVTRVKSVTPEIEAGNVYLPHPMLYPWVDDFIDRCAKFPRVDNDDIIDQMSQFLMSVRNNEQQVNVYDLVF